MRPEKSYISKIFKGEALANFFHLGLNQGVNVITALVATPLLYQKLGESNFGIVNLALSVVMLLAVFVGYGYNLNAPKHLAIIKESKQEVSEYVSGVIFTRVLIALFIVVIFSVLIYGFGLFDKYPEILALSLIYLISEALHPVIILQGFDKLLPLAIGNALTKVGYICGIFLIIDGPADAKWVNFMFGASTLIINFFTLGYISRTWHIRFLSSHFKSFIDNVSANFHFLLSTLASFVLVNGGYIILSNFVQERELGQYALAQRIALLLRTIPVFLSQSILQNASRLYNQDKDAFKEYLSRSYKNGLVITALMGIVFVLISDWVILILSGESVPYSANILRVLCFLPFMGMLNVANIIKILVAEYKQVMSASLWVSTALMLGLSLLGSFYFGGMGLAVGLLISEAGTFVIHFFFLKRRLSHMRG